MTKNELLVDRLQSARNWTLSLLEDIEEPLWFEIPAAGVNHIAWQVGHLAVSQVALIHVRCFGRPADACGPAGFREKFGRGSTPVADPGRYPSISEIRSAFDGIHGEVIDLVRGMSDADLAGKTPGEPHPLFSTKEGAVGTAIIHEGFHAGQIAMLRRMAGKPPLR